MPEHALGETGRDLPNILAIIVLYKTRPNESTAFTTLVAELKRVQQPDDRLRVLLYDNSSGTQPLEDDFPPYVFYHAAGHNTGIAGAYNYALSIARREGFNWMLTLDQDTQLPVDFLAQLRDLALRLEQNEEIGAIVPQLSHAGRPLSPFRIRPLGQSNLLPGFVGMARGEICALNSASLFRVRALNEIGGFDPRFWLDYQDYYVFRQLHRQGKRVWVAGEIQVEHNLSLLSEKQSPGLDRFRNFLQAESVFCDLYRGHIDGLALTGRLTCRLWRQRRTGVDTAVRQLTLDALKRRLFLTKKRRICEWESEMQQRMASLPEQQDNPQRPSISVCMAAFNGEVYIRQQLQSILDQLSDHDEVIVVDDASSDRTCDVVESLRDARIRLERHASNLGVLRSFEDAIRTAHGDILFLADQDDLWAPEKVSAVLHTFSIHPNADVVVSDAALIDGKDVPIGASYYATGSPFRPGILSNLLHCRYLGCTMAFRSRIRSKILPFPSNAAVLHDLWIGVANSFAGGKSVYIDSPLVLYRRHGSNATGTKRLPLARQIRIRWDLCRSLAQSWSRLQRSSSIR
jgi:glycosyltransferase involved in cell wall biosynthesis